MPTLQLSIFFFGNAYNNVIFDLTNNGTAINGTIYTRSTLD